MRCLLVVFAILTSVSFAQPSDCRAKLSIQPHTNKQIEWLTQTGERKYHVCPRPKDQAGDYVIVFSPEQRELSRSVPVSQSRTTAQIDVQTNVYGTQAPITANTAGTLNSQTTTYEDQPWHYQIVYTYVYRYEPDNPVKPGERWHATAPPLYVKSRSGLWHKNADRLALEDALKFIAKQTPGK